MSHCLPAIAELLVYSVPCNALHWIDNDFYDSIIVLLYNNVINTNKINMLQEISYTMRLLTNSLFQLEDKIDIVVTCPILPEVNTV